MIIVDQGNYIQRYYYVLYEAVALASRIRYKLQELQSMHLSMVAKLYCGKSIALTKDAKYSNLSVKTIGSSFNLVASVLHPIFAGLDLE